MITTIILLFIAVILWGLLSQSSKRTEIAQRQERLQHDNQHATVPEEIAQMVRGGDKVGAVRAYRQLTGCSFEIAMAKVSGIRSA